MSIRGRCPKCGVPLTVEELRASPTVCPSCKTELQVFLKANWVYPVVSYTIGVVSITFKATRALFWSGALFYGTVIFGSITVYRWVLHLPIKVVEKPDYRLFPTDT